MQLFRANDTQNLHDCGKIDSHENRCTGQWLSNSPAITALRLQFNVNGFKILTDEMINKYSDGRKRFYSGIYTCPCRWLPCDYCYVSICSIYLHFSRITQTFVDMHLIVAFALSVAHARSAHARIASFTLGAMGGGGR